YVCRVTSPATRGPHTSHKHGYALSRRCLSCRPAHLLISPTKRLDIQLRECIIVLWRSSIGTRCVATIVISAWPERRQGDRRGRVARDRWRDSGILPVRGSGPSRRRQGSRRAVPPSGPR